MGQVTGVAFFLQPPASSLLPPPRFQAAYSLEFWFSLSWPTGTVCEKGESFFVVPR
jgi:hypothetical protein